MDPEPNRIINALAQVERIAIVRLGSIGDVIATLPIAWLLREVLPRTARISWIAHPAPARLLQGVAAIDEVISLGRTSIPFAIHAYRRALRPARIGAVIDLHGNLKSGVVTYLTGAPVRIGLHRTDCREHWNPLFTNYKLPPLSSGNKTRRALEVGSLLGIEKPAIRFGLEFSAAENERAAAAIGGLGGSGPVSVLQLGRLADVRNWPPENYRELALGLLAEGRRVVILGGPDEMESAAALRQILPEGTPGLGYETGTLSLREVGALCRLLAGDSGSDHGFVGPDSGCLHLAVACGLRTLGLHGPQDPARTAPVGPGFEILYHPEAAPCIPCGRRECFHSVLLACMKSITPPEVIGRATGAAPRIDSTLPAAGGVVPRSLPEPAAGQKSLQVKGLLFLAALLSIIVAARHSTGSLPAISIFSTTTLTAMAYFLGKRIGGHRAGFLSGLFLLGMWAFLVWPLSLWAGPFGLLVNASLLFYFEGDEERGLLKSMGIPLAALAAGAAFAFGGWPGLLVPAAAVLAFHAGEKSPRMLLRPKVLLSAAGALGLCLGLASTLESLLRDFRIAGAPPASPAPGSFLLQAFLGALPAAALLPFALFAHFKTRRYREDLGFADRRWRFPKAAFAGGLLALVLYPARLPEHLLAIYPSLAILIASWWERLWPRRGAPNGR